MVDSIGVKPTVPASRTTAVADQKGDVATARTAAQPQSAPTPAAAAASAVSGLVQTLAATPPVDADRVSRIRHAIANGSYPIVAETIADRLLAIRLNWRPHDEA